MEYSQIVMLLVVAMAIYYAVMIVMDIQRAKAMQTAEQENCSEEDIDISDEAKSFRPVQISREEPKKKEEPKAPQQGEGNPNNQYREPIMTDGILVEELIDEVDKMAATGTSDLGAVIYHCDKVR